MKNEIELNNEVYDIFLQYDYCVVDLQAQRCIRIWEDVSGKLQW